MKTLQKGPLILNVFTQIRVTQRINAIFRKLNQKKKKKKKIMKVWDLKGASFLS